MKLLTKAFGEIDISEKQRLVFKNGIFGFEDVTNFALLDSTENSPFYWLQSEKLKNVAFLLIDPKIVYPDYELEVDPFDLEDLEIEDKEDIIVLSIVTLHETPIKSTINLLGPIVLNRKKHLGKQVIATNESYTVRNPLIRDKEV